VCAQPLEMDPLQEAVYQTLSDDPLGIPPYKAQIALQQDMVKELVNKVSWALGSVYRRNYSNMKTPARAYAWRIVKQILKDHGYPDKIAK